VSSVAVQTRLPVEIILIDDFSADGTTELLHDISGRYPKRWIKVIEETSNCGPGRARNTGWDKASQPYLAFLDSDDSWHPQKLEFQYSWMMRHPHVDLSGHACQVTATPVPKIVSYAISDFECTPVSLGQLLISNRFSTPSVMLKTGLPNRFARNKRRSEDYLLWMEIASGGHCATSALPLAFLYKEAYGIGGLSGDLWGMTKGELDTYRLMAEMGHMSRLALIGLYPWCLFKFLRRLTHTEIRRRTNTGEAHV
jgi:glycosyltransferase involved in cell wall biosynthesis